MKFRKKMWGRVGECKTSLLLLGFYQASVHSRSLPFDPCLPRGLGAYDRSDSQRWVSFICGSNSDALLPAMPSYVGQGDLSVCFGLIR